MRKKIATTADIYSSNYNDDDSYKATSLSNLPLHDKFVSYGTNFHKQHFVPKPTKDSTIRSADNSSNTSDVVKRLDANAHAHGNTKTFVSTTKHAGQLVNETIMFCM